MTRLDKLRTHHRKEALRRGIPPRDVDLLLADLLGRSIAWVIAHGEASLDAAPLEALLARRYNGEPLQYIRGRTEFYGREFVVDDRVLIPRPETEVLVETAIARLPRGARVVDVGTGSGCIAVTLAFERPDLRVIGVDRSLGALAVARRNGLKDAVASDVLSAVRNFDAVVSNPPYIPEREIDTLARELHHEPRMALTPGERGTEIIERILKEAYPRPVILEIGYGQAERIRELARPYVVEAVVNDLAGIERVVVLSAHG